MPGHGAGPVCEEARDQCRDLEWVGLLQHRSREVTVDAVGALADQDRAAPEVRVGVGALDDHGDAVDRRVADLGPHARRVYEVPAGEGCERRVGEEPLAEPGFEPRGGVNALYDAGGESDPRGEGEIAVAGAAPVDPGPAEAVRHAD